MATVPVPDITICTSCYAMIRSMSDPKPLAIGISRGKPGWFKGPVLIEAAPDMDVIKSGKSGEISTAQFQDYYTRLLNSLDPQVVVEKIIDIANGASSVALLCWFARDVAIGKFDCACHRRMFAEWIEHHTHLVVTEYGFERSQVETLLEFVS